MQQPGNGKTLEGDVYYPPSDIVRDANVGEYDQLYKYSLEDPEAFWGERAGELEWFEPWDKVLDDSQVTCARFRTMPCAARLPNLPMCSKAWA